MCMFSISVKASSDEYLEFSGDTCRVCNKSYFFLCLSLRQYDTFVALAIAFNLGRNKLPRPGPFSLDYKNKNKNKNFIYQIKDPQGAYVLQWLDITTNTMQNKGLLLTHINIYKH